MRDIKEKEVLFIEALKLLSRFSEEVGTESYIFGGLTLDIWAGELLRDHHDIDVLTVNLHSVESELSRRFAHTGHEALRLENDDIKVIKENVKIHFGNLLLEGDRAEWTHNGDKESLLFPKAWLDRTPHSLYDFNLFTVKPEFEYVLKMYPDLINPNWVPRTKDIAARRKLTKMLQTQYDNPSVLRKSVEVRVENSDEIPIGMINKGTKST